MRYFLLLILLLLFSVADVLLGSVYIPFEKILAAFFENNQEINQNLTESISTQNIIIQNIVFQLRLPKLLTAILVGAGLSVAGLQMQTLFQNPLAGASEMGVSAGAGLGVAVVTLTSITSGLTFVRNWGFSQSWLVVIAAIFGAILVMLLILVLSLRLKNNVALLIVGLMTSSVVMSVVGLWQYFSSPEELQSYMTWTYGSLSGLNKNQVIVLFICVLVGLLIAITILKPLNAFLLGANYAQSMGVRVRSVRLRIIVSTSILAGAITAFCGPIGFVSVAVPHLARTWLKTTNHLVLMPICALLGAILLILCDILSRVLSENYILPINAITSLLGAPVVILMIWKKN